MPREKLVGGCPRAPGRMGKPLALTKLSSSDLLLPPSPTPPPLPHSCLLVLEGKQGVMCE